MITELSNSLLVDFSNFITNEIGLHFPKDKMNDLEKGIRLASQAFHYEDVEACIYWLMSSPLNQKQVEILASYLTIGETYFFRDSNMFRILEKTILPSIIYKRYQEKNKILRIWSAGCATGEEPYSIAIVLHKLIPDIQNWNITLLSTDINTDFLKRLSLGVYSEWSFRGVSDEIKKTYFKISKEKKYELVPAIRQLVSPSYLNLAKDKYPSLITNTNAMDIIFCRNVLMYFSTELSKKIVKRFYNCLINGGYLIVSAGEVMQPCFLDYKMEVINGVTICKRNDHEAITFAALPNEPIATKINIDEKPKVIIPDYKALTQEYANIGKFEEALSCNDKALSANKTDADLYYLRALILLELHNFSEAVTALKRVLYLDSNCILAYVVLGNIYKKMIKIREADKQYANALTLLSDRRANEMIGDITAERLIDFIHTMQEME